MPETHREVEREYEASDNATMPALGALPGVTRARRAGRHRLDAVYFDTADLALARAGVSLRRRSGGDDDGWHLKLPADGDERIEVRVPLGRSVRTVPKALRSAVREYRRDEPLSPVAAVISERVVTELLDGRRVLASVSDDRVLATSSPPDAEPVEQRWREWEVELVEGEPSLLDAAGPVLDAAGGRRAVRASKLTRALGDRLPPPSEQPARLTAGAAASSVIGERLRAQVGEFRHEAVRVRVGLPGGVHRARVALRRLRSALATFRPFVDPEVTEPLRDELRWIAGLLGEARDAEVLRTRHDRLLADEPNELVRGPVRRRLDRHLDASGHDALTAVREAMDSERYLALLAALDRLVEETAWTPAADQQARDVLPQRVRHDQKRVLRAVEHAAASTDTAERDLLLHEARKAAKRSRYAAETLEPLYGKDARRFVSRLKQVQTTLGDHHDSVVMRDLLVTLADAAEQAGESSFSYGRLHAHAEADTHHSVQAFDEAWHQANANKRQRWLRT